ncbi:MAG TPA: response regulator [Blastocatellia bacterium]|nr:response regulator [Blastocatellia bacterium]
MSASINKVILIVEPDTNFREELYNFLLSAGYENVDSVESFEQSLKRIEESCYDVVISDASVGPTDVLSFARAVTRIRPGSEVILMITPESQKEWNGQARNTGEFQCVVKTTFARNLLYLLEYRSV